jgi:hypothetical protein
MSETFSQRPGSPDEETVSPLDFGIDRRCLFRPRLGFSGWRVFVSGGPAVKSGFLLARKPKGQIAPLA